MLSSIFAQRKRTRDELQLSHDDLEQRVEKRTLELHEANQKLRVEIEERIKAGEASTKSARDEAVEASRL